MSSMRLNAPSVMCAATGGKGSDTKIQPCHVSFFLLESLWYRVYKLVRVLIPAGSFLLLHFATKREPLSVCIMDVCMRLLLRTFQSFLVLAIGETKQHRTQKEEKFKKEDEPLLCLKFINIYIFICDRKEEEQLTLPRIITPAFSRMDPGRQEGAFLQVISLDC